MGNFNLLTRQQLRVGRLQAATSVWDFDKLHRMGIEMNSYNMGTKRMHAAKTCELLDKGFVLVVAYKMAMNEMGI